MALLGGAQSPFGAALGTVLIVLLPEWLRFLKTRQHLSGDLRAGRDPDHGVHARGHLGLVAQLPGSGCASRSYRQSRPSPPLELRHQARASTPMLKLENLQKHFGGLKAVDGHRPRGRAGHGARADRSERFGQDHLAERRQRHLSAHRGQDHSSTASTSPDLEAARAGRAGYGPHLPEHPPVPDHDRAGERDGRRAARQQPDRARARSAGARARCRRCEFVGHPAPRAHGRAQPAVRAPAAGRDRARTGRASQAAAARRARRRIEPDREAGAGGAAQAPARATASPSS